MSGVPEETWKRVVENELHESSEELRKLTMERRKAKAKGPRVVSFRIQRLGVVDADADNDGLDDGDLT